LGKTVKYVGHVILECILRTDKSRLTSADMNKSAIFNCLKQGPMF
jgi:hypothetical protein